MDEMISNISEQVAGIERIYVDKAHLFGLPLYLR